MPSAEDCWHLDPDRRVDGRRSTQVRWHSPGPEVIDRWLTTTPQGVVKLAPAAEVSQAWQTEAEREWVSRDRQCRQQLVWFGQLARTPGQHRATTLQTSFDENTLSTACGFTGTPGLAAQLELGAISTGPSYLTADHSVDHPLVSRFRVVDQLPLREKPLASHLRSLGIGRLEIKKRGVQRDPEELRRRLKLEGDASATLLMTRQRDRKIAILAERSPQGATVNSQGREPLE